MKITTLADVQARTVATETGCHEWQGACNNTGYGNARFNKKPVCVHRLVAFFAGLVPSPHAPTNRKSSGFVLHSCDNRKCCNPAHLRVGTYSENMFDAYRRKRKAQPQGAHHANSKLTEQNVRDIRTRYAAGTSQDDLGKQYGVSQRTVSLIVRRETYTNVA